MEHSDLEPSIDSSQLGTLVSPATARQPSLSPGLIGEHVSIVGLTVEHAANIFEVIGGFENAERFKYLRQGPFSQEKDVQDLFTSLQGSTDPIWYTILCNKTSTAVGYCSLMRIDSSNRVIEIGSICYSPILQGTIGGTEAMYLLARYVFEDLGYRRYEWKCDSNNKPSKRAAKRLGFEYEGLFRQHMIVRGRNRDTSWYSMLDYEWPERKLAFIGWLDSANFDDNGRQRKNLQAFR